MSKAMTDSGRLGDRRQRFGRLGVYTASQHETSKLRQAQASAPIPHFAAPSSVSHAGGKT